MLRGYRGILCALVGLALVGAGQPPKTAEQPEQQPPQSELEQAATTVSEAISSLKESDDDNPSCKRGDDNRDSDLCAQWKAADAARDAARYALLGLLVGIVGTSMLIWTFLEQRRTTRAQLRAYLAIEPAGLLGLPDHPAAQVCMRNAGGTPAHGIRFSLMGRVDDPDLSEEAIKALQQRAVASHEDEMFMAAQQELFRPLPIDGLNEAMLQAARDGRRWLYMAGCVTYDDVFKEKRHTWFCHTYSGDLKGGIYRYGNRAD